MNTRSLSSALFVLAVNGLLMAQQAPLYKDPSQPVEKRVADLIGRMTLAEKASQLVSQSPAIERLGIPAYDWWNEALHGVARAGRATVFPQPIGLAATWDSNLIFRMATTISDEARAKHQEFLRRGKHGIYQGLTFWSPNVNLFRDPRWGRGMETYGEDPFLTGSLGTQFVRGMQGDDPKYLKTVATPKHFAVHSGPESTRHVADVHADATDLHETYLPHFEMAVKAGRAESVMCSYNAIDGLPACSNGRLLTGILRQEWNFHGYVVSDCGAVSDIYDFHKAAKTAAQGVAMAVRAGTDVDCGLEFEHIVPAVKQGLLTEKDVDQALTRALTARFRLGMFDPPEMVRWTKIPYSVNESKEHGELAAEVARKSIVLLKNNGGLLPVKRDVKTIAVIGPNADSRDVLLGNYNGEPSHVVTPLAGIRKKVGPGTRVLYARGTDLAPGMPSFELVPAAALFTAASGTEHGLAAKYFNTANFNGKAYIGEAFVSEAMLKRAHVPANPKPLFERVDAQVDFDWKDGAPRKDMNDDDFGVRWSGYLEAPVSGKYELGAIGMTAFELYLDGKRVAETNNVHERGYRYDSVELQAGKRYAIRLDFHETIGDANIQLVWAPPHGDLEPAALDAARQADVVLMFLGLSPRLEGEEMKVEVEGFKGGDRIKLGIPQVQEDLLRKVSALGKPVVLVLMNGSAVAVNWAREHVPAIVELWYPGQAGGTALADVLFGDSNPAGRLPVTFYQSEAQLPPFEDYQMQGRTYRYFQGQPLFPFGYGLSYTTFAYHGLRLPPEIAPGEPLKVTAEVENTGTRAGDEVVQLYLTHAGSPGAPIRSLEGFQRITLAAHQKKTVEFTLSPRQLARFRDGQGWMVEPGTVRISVGGKQPGFTGLLDAATTGVVTGELQIAGTAKRVE